MFKTPRTLTMLTACVLSLSHSALGQDQTIGASDPRLTNFATQVIDYSPATLSLLISSVTDPSAALGAPNSGSTGSPDFFPTGLTSLGDAPGGETPGSITLGFANPIFNGAGGDFAVFENASDFGAFNTPPTTSIFAELAFVQVSTDGINFAEFEALSLTTFPDSNTPPSTTDLQLDFNGNQDFATITDRNLVSGFAGADPANTGTLFDLDSLTNNSLVLSGAVDLSEINYVRLIDIPGDGRFTDIEDNAIFDAFSPNNITGGFDLDAIGVINAVPEPSTLLLLCGTGGLLATRRKR